MNPLLPAQYESLVDRFEQPQNFRASKGGHMAYSRLLFDDQHGQTYFVKAHDPSLLTEEWRRKEMKYFLDKEARIYRHLESHGFAFAPRLELYDEDMLVLTGLTEQDGWQWRAPTNPQQRERYTSDITAAFTALESIPVPPLSDDDEVSIDTFYNHGWDKLHDINIDELIATNLQRWSNELQRDLPAEAAALTQNVGSLTVKRAHMSRHVLNHHDARQSNIAWHPDHGAQIVDWSWAEGGLPNGDTTMLIIDLHKSGHDTANAAHTINPTYAKMMLGYWLHRSQTEHMEGNDNVRMQQFISAVKAGVLLSEIPEITS